MLRNDTVANSMVKAKRKTESSTYAMTREPKPAGSDASSDSSAGTSAASSSRAAGPGSEATIALGRRARSVLAIAGSLSERRPANGLITWASSPVPIHSTYAAALAPVPAQSAHRRVPAGYRVGRPRHRHQQRRVAQGWDERVQRRRLGDAALRRQVALLSRREVSDPPQYRAGERHAAAVLRPDEEHRHAGG